MDNPTTTVNGCRQGHGMLYHANFMLPVMRVAG